MRRFFLDSPVGPFMEISGKDAHHIGRVLRMKPGDLLVAAGTDGKTCRARIDTITEQRVALTLETLLEEMAEPPLTVTLAQGLPKGDKLEWVVQKSVELGVYRIFPLQCANSVVRYDREKATGKVERLQKIAAEAAKQCGRQVVPTVGPVRSLPQLLAELTAETLAIMPYEGETIQTLAEVLTERNAQNLLLIIGPEGGFTPQEVALCRQNGVRTVTLGPRILRTETAALAALSILMYQCGDLGARRYLS